MFTLMIRILAGPTFWDNFVYLKEKNTQSWGYAAIMCLVAP